MRGCPGSWTFHRVIELPLMQRADPSNTWSGLVTSIAWMAMVMSGC